MIEKNHRLPVKAIAIAFLFLFLFSSSILAGNKPNHAKAEEPKWQILAAQSTSSAAFYVGVPHF